MEIFRGESAKHAIKPEGTKVDYYIFPEYEIHYNEVPPGTKQIWHHHKQIEETVLILDGELEAYWKDDDNKKQHTTITKGDLVRVENTPHTFANLSQASAKFVVFRLVLTGSNHSGLIKADKYIDKQR